MNTDQLKSYIEKQFAIPVDEGPDKVMTLQDAVRRYIQPEMSLYFAFFHSRAHALAYEVARQFWGQRPNFEIISAGILEFAVILVQGGLVRKLTAAFGGNTYPYPSPNKVVQHAVKKGEVEIETWTNLTIPIRLLCGALNLPFMVTNSIYGSGIASSNAHAYRRIQNPFDPEKEVGVVSPLHPDIALVHGFAADRCGNTIVLAPYGEDIWGLMACNHGILVTAEHIVSTEFIREHSHLVKIPGYLVKAVIEAPFGAHPQPMTNLGLEQFQGYGEDYQFRLDFKTASQSSKEMTEWINHWVLDCPTHDDYLRKIGREKIFYLKGKSAKEAWRYDLLDQVDKISMKPEFTANEAMIISAARGIKEVIIDNGYKVVLAGAGMANLASWIAVYDLKQQGHDVELLAESGFYGYLPRPMDPYIFNFSNILTNKIQAGFVEILGLMAGGHNNRCLAVIGAGQVDKNGNVNSTRLADGLFIVGSGGANDLGSSASEVILLCQQGREKFVDRLTYITTSGARVSRLYSGMGVYLKEAGDGEFVLSALVPGAEARDEKDHIESIKSACAWDLKVAENIGIEEPPTLEELVSLRLFDPERFLIGSDGFSEKGHEETSSQESTE